MTVDPRNTDNRPGTNPNRGLNVRTFSLTVIAALVVLLAIGFFFVRGRTSAASPEQNQAPSSRGPQPSSGSSESGHTQTQ
jgi:hypothetical protein